MAREVVFLQLVCRWPDCGAPFVICRPCYRGQAYCGERCQAKGRRQRRREANRRHQQSLEGRLDHRDRQRAYRERRRRDRVTDTPSPAHLDSETILQPKFERSPIGSQDCSEEHAYADIIKVEPGCIVCGRPAKFIDPFPDWG